ncbi:21391_t:CDS:1 [Cetraspora pellucida]|uniref:21391_t:CDS:1 n=1 Tax=Cetraspora pellucida TaxID=1433469 RepID=A0A9N9J2F1_9GLOM|nr:21391_t:CDS:1 [Cetraspora pellucida]
MCYERYAKKRREKNPISRKKSKTDISTDITVLVISTSSSQINNVPDTLQVNSSFENYDNFEPTLEANFFENEFANILQTEEIEHIISSQSDEYDNINTISYCIDEVERFIAIQFQNAKSSKEPAKFEFEIELDSGLLDAVKLGQDLETNPLNLEKIKSSFVQLTKILTLPLKSGSEYY